MIDAARQLQTELDGSIRQAVRSGRPILTHINADTTWLVQVPYPSDFKLKGGRAFFNILIDPWLKGPQSDVASWFSTQYHVTESSVQSIQELEESLRETQRLASGTTNNSAGLDAVAISHEFTDHCHRATLLEIDPCVPVFAADKAADLIRSWKHFDTVITTPILSFDQRDWRKTSQLPLPDWIGISRIITKDNQLYYHAALCITFAPESYPADIEAEAEAVVYSPHGIDAADLKILPEAKPKIRTLALLHGLHDVGISSWKQLNLGAHNGLRAQKICKAKYWVGTHDEVKKAGGFLAPFLRRSIITVEEALEKARGENREFGEDSGMPADLHEPYFADLQSGESLLLV